MSSVFQSSAYTSSLSFPTIEMAAERWQWPLPPFEWRHRPAPDSDAGQPCTIETKRGTLVQGEVLKFHSEKKRLVFRSEVDNSTGYVSFDRMRRLTLSVPLTGEPRAPGAPAGRVPVAAQEREYRLQMADSGAPKFGQTVGYIENDEGLFLFISSDEETSLQRVFVPRSAYTAVAFGASIEERAAARWISSPEALLQAIERQATMPVLPIGDALLNLGLVTPAQLDRALSGQRGDMPLGELLVATGIIKKSDLQAALAHKMGYPLVDLMRFPIEEAASRALALRAATECFAVPLMIRNGTLIVAVDRLSRATKLHNVRALAGLKIVPVLASKNHMMVTLGEMAQRDKWSQNVFARLVFPPSQS